jgi:hypothetical protein
MNCGECLMEHVTIVKLPEDGTECPCCKRKHKVVLWKGQFIGIIDSAKGSQAYVLFLNPDGSVGAGNWIEQYELEDKR